MSDEKKYVSQKFIEAITTKIWPIMMATSFEKISDSRPFGKDDVCLATDRMIPDLIGTTDGGSITWPDIPERTVSDKILPQG